MATEQARAGEARGAAGLAPSSRVRAALAAAAVAAMAAAAIAIAAGAAAGPSFAVLFGLERFPGWLRGPWAVLGAPSLSETAFSALVLAMCAGYGGLLALAGSIPPRPAVAAVGALHLIFVAAPLLFTTDAFGYIDYARLAVVHDLNPYAVGADAAPGDPVHPFVIWHEDPSPYGPLFTMVTYPLATIDFRIALWVVKLSAAGASLGCVALVWRCARLRGRDPVFPALLVGLNPVLLVWAVGGAHNDLLLVLLTLVGVERFLARADASGAAALVGAAAVKASGALVLPFAIAGTRRRGRALAGAAAAAAGIAALATLALGAGVLAEYPSAVAIQQGLVSEHSIPTYLGELAGLGGATGGLRLVAGAGLATALALLLLRAWRGADWLAAAAWATLALLLSTAWLMPWYLVWLLPLAALSRSRPLEAAALAMTAFVVVTRLFG